MPLRLYVVVKRNTQWLHLTNPKTPTFNEVGVLRYTRAITDKGSGNMHYIKKENAIYAMDKYNVPVCKVNSGETITFEAYDCFTNQLTDVSSFTALDWDKINPATGPVYVTDAEPGDILAVHIKELAIGDTVTMVTGPNMGVLGDELTDTTFKRFSIEDNHIQFTEAIKIPLNKMIGVIGTAPVGEAISCGTPDAHGGNMDCKEITEGTTLYLPVNVDGALLAMGDCHAAMGDGEVSVCGGEVPCEITVTVEVIKGKKWPTPFYIKDGELNTLSSQKTLDAASVEATKHMVDFVVRYSDLTKGEAVHLLSLVGNLRICQVVDPNKTVRMALPLSYLPKW